MFRFRALAVTFVMLMVSVGYAEQITVSAAISLKEALLAIAKDYEASTGNKVEFNFGASGQLMAQIKQGAPVDLFVSASEAQTMQLRKDGLTTGAPDRIIARNRLVLIVPEGRDSPAAFADLANSAIARIAIGQPKTVPAGDYAMQVLEKLGIASATKDRLILGANVRQVLDYVVRGEVDAGIVYATDAREPGEKVKVVATADASWHRAITYPAVVLRGSQHQAAASEFLGFLGEAKTRSRLAQCGFGVDEP